MTKIFNSIVDLEIELKEVRGNCEIIAFVPTMGALHQGHLQLVKEAQKIADKVVMSIFVNPTQFNDKNDLDKYPKTLDADIKLVQTVGLDYLYVPDETEIYPPEKIVELELNLLHYDQVMEGAFRPGHFKGVCQVVKRLLDLVDPHILVMGQKDFQQYSIIQFMIDQLLLPIRLHVVNTKRDSRGLALSSRNMRLSESGRIKAATIFRTMKTIKSKIKLEGISFLESYGFNRLKRAGFEPEYVSIVDGSDLKNITSIHGTKYAVICVAAWLEKVRLIDNMVLFDER